MMADTIPDDAGYENTRPYRARGWCSFELQMSTIVKHQYCAWDVRMHVRGMDYGAMIQALKAMRPVPLRAPTSTPRTL